MFSPTRIKCGFDEIIFSVCYVYYNSIDSSYMEGGFFSPTISLGVPVYQIIAIPSHSQFGYLCSLSFYPIRYGNLIS